MNPPPLLFLPFKVDVSNTPLPQKFTFPFNYSPHKVAEIATKELQEYLETQTEWTHDFGLKNNESKNALGKMFGVLVCQNQEGKLGQLWAFSGKLAEQNHWPNFVPTIYDMLSKDSFFKKEEAILNEYNAQIEKISQSQEYIDCVNENDELNKLAKETIDKQKEKIKTLKRERDIKREYARKDTNKSNIDSLLDKLNEESKKENIILKKMNKYWKEKLAFSNKQNLNLEEKILLLKKARKEKSSELQQKLFSEYVFLNQQKEPKSLGDIFNNNPPAGAGECAAPKLLNYAFKHNLTPIAMAEFWWGTPPKSKIRKHKQFYPACKSKCEPILMKHMLKGIEMDQNPITESISKEKKLSIVYEDDYLIVLNKPINLLSIPGKEVKNSAYQIIKTLYPNASGPLIVHRLDMSTSGIMLVAKDEDTHKKLQSQFIKRTIKKKYIALLDGIVKSPKGTIDLPLRVDLEDRPKQLVCYEYGKPAKTHYQVIQIKNKKTLIHFFPITGRTHQLRVHAAHHLGLGMPIVGDDLYGNQADRLHLHAEWIQFQHPSMNKTMEFTVENDFNF